MQGIKIKINDYKVGNTFDMIRVDLRLTTLCNNLTLSDTELYSLTYFVINGYNSITREELITTKIIKSKNGVANLVSKFRRMGIIIKPSYKEVIAPEYLIPSKDIDAIKIDLIIKK